MRFFDAATPSSSSSAPSFTEAARHIPVFEGPSRPSLLSLGSRLRDVREILTTARRPAHCQEKAGAAAPKAKEDQQEPLLRAKTSMSKLRDEISEAEQEIEDCIARVRDGNRAARDQVLEHCDRMQTVLASRKSLFLQELDRLESLRLALLQQQKHQLRAVRRNISVNGNETTADVENCLLEAESMVRTFERRSSRNGNGGNGVGQSPSSGGTSHQDPPGHQDRPKPMVRSKSGTTMPSLGTLITNLQERLRLTPCVDPTINLDFREWQLIPLVERLGAITTNDFILEEELVGPLIVSDAMLGHAQFPELWDRSKRKKPLPPEMKRVATLFGGCLAGITSATLTHGLDVAKVLRQVGGRPPDSLRGYFTGLPMGAVAQGQRFGVTLFLNQTLQQALKRQEHNAVMSFAGSMLASGVGEFLANPPVVVKNFQIAHAQPSSFRAMRALYDINGVPAYFRGVVFGVVRKSLANAIVLQSIGPTKLVLAPYFVMPGTGGTGAGGEQVENKSLLANMGIGFIAGSLTGSFAEVATNYPDRVKTLMQTKKTSMWDACREAARDPFRGALWAGVRKGAIRGLNWGTVGLYTTLFEEWYWKYKRVEAVL